MKKLSRWAKRFLEFFDQEMYNGNQASATVLFDSWCRNSNLSADDKAALLSYIEANGIL